ncbi:MAG TPA: NfeD family protein [Chitinispirillaceae bacterium]|nr:NfeD family protein [Chitinispirillaceae bacterium]
MGNILWPILLQLIGILVIIAEFILPSFGVLTITSLAIFGYSLYLVFTGVSVSAGYMFVVFDLLLIPVLVIVEIKLLAFLPVTLRKTLSSKEGANAQPQELTSLIGISGSAITDLRPSGAASLNGQRYDVVSTGEYIEKGSCIIVTIVDGNRIVVKKSKSDINTVSDQNQ